MANVTLVSTELREQALAEYRRRLENDLALAERVHRSMIPETGRRGDLEIACRFVPQIGVGGDYASVHFQTDRRVAICVCDIAGHGVASALLATRVHSFVLHYASSVAHPCELVRALNDFVYRTFEGERLYLTFFAVFLDLARRRMTAAGCGHPPVLHRREEDGQVHRLESDNVPIGLFEHLSTECSMDEFPFEPGDRLLLYTDGITDTISPEGEPLGIDRLERYLRRTATDDPQASLDRLVEEVVEFRGDAPITDDQLLLGIAYR